jgi:translation elongation factor EF-1beta
MVIRTVNRGGAQCGFHFVPRLNGYYLGAGNYIKAEGITSHRLETLRYLIDTFETELGGSEITYQLEGDIIKGHRPRALDGFPLIGPLSVHRDFFVASGTNRAGLTWAPAIAEQIISWVKNEPQEILDPEQYELIQPERKPISFGTAAQAIEYYVESRIGAAIEHAKIENLPGSIDGETTRLNEYAVELLSSIGTLSDPSSVPHPDHWAAILDKPSLCVELK